MEFRRVLFRSNSMMLGIFWGRTVMTPTSGAGGGAGGASLEQPARALQAAATAQANLLSKIFHRCILEVPIAQARPSLQNVGRGPSVTSLTSQRPTREIGRAHVYSSH